MPFHKKDNFTQFFNLKIISIFRGGHIYQTLISKAFVLLSVNANKAAVDENQGHPNPEHIHHHGGINQMITLKNGPPVGTHWPVSLEHAHDFIINHSSHLV